MMLLDSTSFATTGGTNLDLIVIKEIYPAISLLVMVDFLQMSGLIDAINLCLISMVAWSKAVSLMP